jgi:hypothetical protein
MVDSKVCETCYGDGHDFRECVNECVYCRKHHNGGICPDCPELYPRVDGEAGARVLENIRKETAEQKRRLHELNEELARADFLEQQIQAIKDEVAASAGGPISQPPASKNAALLAMGKKVDGTHSTWRDIHLGWEQAGNQAALKAQWNAEALGQQQFAEDSMLKAALVNSGRWPIKRDANGFPIE